MKTVAPRSRQRERGIAVVVVLAILSILLMVIASNLCHLNDLGREIRLIEKKQIRRIEARENMRTNATDVASAPGTNVVQDAIGK